MAEYPKSPAWPESRRGLDEDSMIEAQSSMLNSRGRSAMNAQQKTATSLCPFNPTAGRPPPYLAGREQEQRSIARYLHLLQHGEQVPFAMVVFGPRGNGKTALLRWAKRLALEKGVDAISVASSMIDSEDALVGELTLGRWWNGIVEAVSGFCLHVRLGGQRAAPIRQVLDKRVRRRPLLITIDEAHTLEPSVGRKLVQAAHEVYGEGGEMLLMFAGTPNLPRHLRKFQSTFWERSRILPITRLDASASADAIRIPLEAMNRPISKEALKQVIQESHGYPYFLQMWGEALWYEAESAERTIGMDDVIRVRPEFEKSRDAFYGLRYEELCDEELVAPAAALAEFFGNREELARSEVIGVLKAVLDGECLPSDPDDIAKLLAKLHNLGYIWSPGGNLSNRYFSGIPSLMDFVAGMTST